MHEVVKIVDKYEIELKGPTDIEENIEDLTEDLDSDGNDEDEDDDSKNDVRTWKNWNWDVEVCSTRSVWFSINR